MPRIRTSNLAQQVPGPKSLLISLHPRFANAIFAGFKQAELRKTKPSVTPGDQLIIYSTKPTAAVLGTATVQSVITAPPPKLWKTLGKRAAVSRTEFFEYFQSRPLAHAILLTNPIALKSPITLSKLRATLPTFIPPQSYWYLREERLRDKQLLTLIARHKQVHPAKRHAA